MSRPARGEWIETFSHDFVQFGQMGLAPRGASGLKHDPIQKWHLRYLCLAPRGASGLKYRKDNGRQRERQVSPREGRVD